MGFTLTKSHHPSSPLPRKSRRYTQPVFFNQVTPSRITTSRISKSPQVRFFIVWSIPCDNKFHTLAVHLHSTLTAPPIRGTFGVRRTSVVEPFCRNSQPVKASGFFPRGAPSWMFDRSLNATRRNSSLELKEGLRRSFPPLGLHKGILDSPSILILWIYIKHKMKLWTHHATSLPWVTIGTKI